jgi:LCP family protein required for cell wall assembly
VNDPTPGPPEYKVYRSRRKPRTGGGDLDSLRKRLSRHRRDDGGPAAPRERRPVTPGRVAKWIALAVAGWLLLSLAVFLISAQTQDGVSAETERALSSEGSLFSGSNILVLGSDVRTGESIDESQQGPGRSDTIMLVHAAFGSVRKLSIPRDVEVDVPGHGINKINAAYALGGPALTIETVESFLGNGLRVNHLVEVDFENFPEFIDSLGGITVDNPTRICSPPFDNFWKGLRFRKGEIALDGTRALGYARIRKNPCAPAEDDRARAARQQKVLAAIGAQVKSPSTFIRLPLVSWNAPRTLKSDMNGPELMMLFADMATGSSDDTQVLEATCCRGSNLFVS